ncbi:glycine zipper 2TM domain-containing protein [Elioraea rosea]|uniref:glycine zipper 2TM domain-containing protein n=1 Tax=Elioraea rosea TaxID=2492390 RepID=UPI001185CF7C|nr:glycine zipper 2TM domain-containing protein [Elioraea rosea]
MLARLSRCRPLALLAASLLLLQACATTNAGGEPLSPAQQQLRSQTERFNDTIATGVVIGAVALGLLGALLGGNNSRGQGAVLGAAAGAALGGAAGYYIATRNEQFANREQAANARISAANREANDLERTALAAEQVAKENRARLTQLQAKVRAGEATASQLRAQAQTAQTDLGLMNEAIEHSRKVESAMRADGAPQAASVADSRKRMEDAARELQGALAQVPAA